MTKTPDRHPVETLDDIFTFDDRHNPKQWNAPILALKAKMEKLKRRKHGTSKQKIIKEKNGETRITARYCNGDHGDLEIMLWAPLNGYTFEERVELVWALWKLEPTTIIGYATIATKLPSFALMEEGHLDDDKIREWHDYPTPVKWISLWFNASKPSPFVKGDPFSGRKVRFEER